MKLTVREGGRSIRYAKGIIEITTESSLPKGDDQSNSDPDSDRIVHNGPRRHQAQRNWQAKSEVGRTEIK